MVCGSWGYKYTSYFSAWLGKPYTGSDGQVAGSAYLDTALVYVDRISTFWMDVGGGPCGSLTRSARSCGYPSDKGGQQMWCSDGQTYANDLCDTNNDALRSNSIFLSGGMSGGPVIVDNRILGINSGFHPRGGAVFAPIDTITTILYSYWYSIWSSTCK